MMRPLVLILFALCLAAGPASAPSAPVEQLDGGRIRLVPPEGWTLVKRGGDGLSLSYKLGDGDDAPTMNITVNLQEATASRESAAKMGLIIGKHLRESAAASNAKILSHPRVIPDDRFLLKVHDRVRSNDNKVRDQVQIYRSMAASMLHVATVAVADNDEAAAPIHAAGAAVADSAKLGAGPKNTVYRKTQVRMAIPSDWVEQRIDDPNGVVAIFTNRDIPNARIVVRAKMVPRDARGNADVQRNTVDMLVDEYRNAAAPDGALAIGEEESLDRPPFAKHVMRSLDRNGEPWGTDFRVRIVGPVAIGIEALSPPEDSLVGRLADQMALSIRGIAETPPGELKLSPAVEKALADRRAAQRRAATQSAALSAASQPSSQPTTEPTRTADTIATPATAMSPTTAPSP